MRGAAPRRGQRVCGGAAAATARGARSPRVHAWRVGAARPPAGHPRPPRRADQLSLRAPAGPVPGPRPPAARPQPGARCPRWTRSWPAAAGLRHTVRGYIYTAQSTRAVPRPPTAARAFLRVRPARMSARVRVGRCRSACVATSRPCDPSDRRRLGSGIR